MMIELRRAFEAEYNLQKKKKKRQKGINHQGNDWRTCPVV